VSLAAVVLFGTFPPGLMTRGLCSARPGFRQLPGGRVGGRACFVSDVFAGSNDAGLVLLDMAVASVNLLPEETYSRLVIS